MTIMDNQLKLLISLCEEEKARLQERINESLAEKEYLMAHYHSEALYQLNTRLQTLNNIDDKLFDEKEFKKRIICYLKKRIETEKSAYIKEDYKKEIQFAEEELEKLNQVSNQLALTDYKILLDETLKKLVDKKIKGLKLILKKSDNLLLSFSYSKKVLKVTLPYVKQHIKNLILYDENINAFKNLGFNLDKNETKLILTLTGKKEDTLNRLKIILSKIVFEIFYFKEFKNESYITFIDNSNYTTIH